MASPVEMWVPPTVWAAEYVQSRAAARFLACFVLRGAHGSFFRPQRALHGGKPFFVQRADTVRPCAPDYCPCRRVAGQLVACTPPWRLQFGAENVQIARQSRRFARAGPVNSKSPPQATRTALRHLRLLWTLQHACSTACWLP